MKSLVVANWKMNPSSFREAKRLFEVTKKAVESTQNISLILAPPAIFLRELRDSYKGTKISFALQNAHWEAGGAHTGEVSLAQARDARVSYVLIGHSERRASGESNGDTRRKVAAALAVGITPILCIGETKRTTSGQHFSVVKEQLRAGFADVAPAHISKVVVAYEPVWAIGGEQTLSPRDMHEMAIFIRKAIVEARGEKGMNIKIMYGAAVTESNVHAMLRDGDVDGLLVGHVSVDAPRFSALLKAIG